MGKEQKRENRRGFSVTESEFLEWEQQSEKRGFLKVIHYLRALVFEDKKALKKEQKKQ